MTSELVTLIPPGTGGVRDYAEIMARHIPTRILAPTPDTPLADYGDGDIVLNFSGYGFHPRGVPTWLVDRLRSSRAGGRKLGIFFHETFAFAPPWRSAFWLSPTQRRIAANLASLATFWLANRDATANWLRSHSSGVPARVLPVYSNVGEPIEATSAARSDKIVVFGSAATRMLAYRAMDAEFWQWVRRRGHVVHDIGPPIDNPAFHALRQAQSIQCHGPLPAAQVSEHLLDARFGVLFYPSQDLAKSGVFAAYCAHGLCSVILAKQYQAQDGLQPNLHYAAGWRAADHSGFDASTVGALARRWYLPHDVQAHVGAFRALLSPTLARGH